MKYLWCILCGIIVLSCSKEDNLTLEIGDNFAEVNTRVIKIDTMTVLASTFKFDSLAITSTNRLLIGSYNDDIFGNTKTESYLQFNRTFNESGSDGDFEIDNEATYDSIALIMNYDHYFYKDTIPIQNYKVHQLTEDIEYDEDAFQYYNTTNFNFEAAPIADNDYQIEPKKEDSLFIKLDDLYGNTLFNKIQEGDIETNEDFLDEYNGLVIKSNVNNTAIVGFNKSSLLRIYYTIPSETDPIEMEFDFSLNTNNSFTHTSNTYENTLFEHLDDQEIQLNSSDANDLSYVQSGLGLTTRIDIPYINRLHDIPGDGVLIDAFLKIPIKTFNPNLNLHVRDSIRGFLINEKSEQLGSIINGSGDVFAILSDESTEFDNAYYSMNLKTFIDLKLDESNFQEDFFIALNPQDFGNSVDRYIFYNTNEEDKKITLELLYAVYDED